MTAIDPFTTPAEAERAGRAKQAQDMLAHASDVKDLSTYNYDTGRRSYKGGVEAMRDAMVGQGYALLAVRDELADIAGSLRTLAALPSAINLLASHVATESALLQQELSDTRAEVADLRSSVEVGGVPIAIAIGSVAAAVDALSEAVEPRPRWWQRRRALREQTAQTAIES